MNLYISIALLGLFAYAGLLALVVHHGWRGRRTHQVFSLYLLTMMLVQLGYLMLPLADNPEQAQFWYIYLIPFLGAQPVLYYFCMQSFLDRWHISRLLFIGLLVWLGIVIASPLLNRQVVYVNLYRDEQSGLFVPEFGPIVPFLAAPAMLFWGLTAINLIREHYRTRSAQPRLRLQYLSLAIVVIWLGMSANLVPALRPYPFDVVSNVISAGLIAYAILRARLLNITNVIRVALLYSISTVILGTAYFLAIYLAITWFQARTKLQLFYLSLAVAVIAAIVLHPLRERIQAWIDRTFFRQEYDGRLMVQRLSQYATTELDLAKLMGMILDEVTRTMYIGWAAFFLNERGREDFSLLAQQGLPAETTLNLPGGPMLGQTLAGRDTTLALADLAVFLPGSALAELARLRTELLVPLRARGELIGLLAVGPKLSTRGYSPDDELILSTLANQTAVALDNARLYEQTCRDAAARATLLDEVNHRVKNNLAAIIGLLYAERRYARNKSHVDFSSLVSELINRIQSLATVHGMLSAVTWNSLPLSDLAGQVITSVLQGIAPVTAIDVEISPNPVLVTPRQAGSLALILNELVTNTVKYAWPAGQSGQIRVQITRQAETVRLEFRDNGPGFPDEVFHQEGYRVGLYLVQNLVTQDMGGRVALHNDQGAVTTIEIPLMST